MISALLLIVMEYGTDLNPMLAEASKFTGSDARVSWLLSKKEKQRVQGVRVPLRRSLVS